MHYRESTVADADSHGSSTESALIHGTCVRIGLLCLFVVFIATDAVPATDNEESTEPWKFVSIPDLMNNDVDYPDPRWDDALDYVLDAIRADQPDFVLVAGDLQPRVGSGLGEDQDLGRGGDDSARSVRVTRCRR